MEISCDAIRRTAVTRHTWNMSESSDSDSDDDSDSDSDSDSSD